MKPNGKKNQKIILIINKKEDFMKKLFILSAVFCLALSTTSAFADNFDALENITPAQKQRLTEVQTLYKPQLNAIV